MRTSVLRAWLAPLLAGVVLLLPGCVEKELGRAVGSPTALAGPPPPSARPAPAFSAIERNLQGLRRGLSNQEERIEEARKAIQVLTDRLEENRREFEAALKNSQRTIEELRGRIEAAEGELTLLRAAAARPGALPGAGAEPTAGAPSKRAGPVGMPAAPAPAGMAAGAPQAGAAPAVGLPAEVAVAVPPPAGSSPAPGVPPSALQEPEAEFHEAERVFREERNFPRARALLGTFLGKHPTHELADDAQFLIGQSYFEEKNFERAILAFNKVQVDYANGDKAPEALLREALSFLSLGDRASARELLGRVVSKYPGSEAAETARERLKSL